MHSMSGAIYVVGGDRKDDKPTITDVAEGLADVFRFGGKTLRPFSVLQHSIVMYRMSLARVLWPGIHLYTLWHDSPEMIQGADLGHGHKTQEQREYEAMVLNWLYRSVLVCPAPEGLAVTITKQWDDVCAYAEVLELCPQSVIHAYQSRRLFDHVPESKSTRLLVAEVACTPREELVDEFVTNTTRWLQHVVDESPRVYLNHRAVSE